MTRLTEVGEQVLARLEYASFYGAAGSLAVLYCDGFYNLANRVISGNDQVLDRVGELAAGAIALSVGAAAVSSLSLRLTNRLSG